ncbi:MAG: hypothetical protein Q8K71_09145 [Polaromonas sp.]|nr:hypothetical protein [Polaromonas sp.]MDP3750854.1 hypothetical protein [Polaromonas sp.]
MSIASENRSTRGTPLHMLQAALGPARGTPHVKPGLIVAGATGALGSEVLRRLAGSGCFAHTQVLAREPMSTGLAQVMIAPVSGDDIASWSASTLAAQTGVVMFEPPRLHHDRERALWTPVPAQLVALAAWLQRCGVTTLVLVLPHAQGSLPQALRLGLASLAEQELAALGFERLLLLRSAQKPPRPVGARPLARIATWMLSVCSYMIPTAALPVRPARVAEFLDAALRVLPPGTHVVGTELLWQGGKPQDMQAVVQAWLNTRLNVQEN